MEARLRRLFKNFLEVRHGESCKTLETALRSAGYHMMRYMSAAEKAKLPEVPVWADSEVLRFFTWPAAQILGKAGPNRPDPPSSLPIFPRPVEKKASSGSTDKAPLSRGFDFYCWLEKEALEKAATKLKRFKKFRRSRWSALLKTAGGRAWARLDLQEKRVYASRAAERKASVRGSDGKFSILPYSDVPFVSGSAGSSTDVAAGSSEDVCTPKKPGKKIATEQRCKDLVWNAVADLLASDETPMKTKQVIRDVVTQAEVPDEKCKRYIRQRTAGHVRFRKSCKAGTFHWGRPKGCTKITDGQLRAALESHSAPSSIMHRKLECPIRTLSASKRRTAKASWGAEEVAVVCSPFQRPLGHFPCHCAAGEVRCLPCLARRWSAAAAGHSPRRLREHREGVGAVLPAVLGGACCDRPLRE